MSVFRRVGAALCAAFVALSCQALASDIALSGRVVKPNAKPLANVTVRLALAGLTATTDSQGTWSLGSASGIRGARSIQLTSAGNLCLDNARLKIRLDGRDISGRGQGIVRENVGKQKSMMARSQITVPDTLVYSYNQKVFLRDTISKFDTAGIVRVYDTTVNSKISYGYLNDTRDGKVYRTVVIGSQTWMAANLNYRTEYSYCFNADTTNCSKYGRLYKWAAAMGLNDSCNEKSCENQIKSNWQGACPSGWHVPSRADWTKLTDTTLEAATAGTKLKANSPLWYYNTGTDEYGFAILPVGGLYYNGYGNDGYYTYFWSASGKRGSDIWFRYSDSMAILSDRIGNIFDYANGYSLRCLKN